MNAAELLHRPIYGGLFGDGQYALASMPAIERGLHAVRYVVVSPRDGVVLAMAGDRGEALAAARRRLSVVGASVTAANDAIYPRQGELWPGLELPEAPPAVRHVSRRRREIFMRSEQRCMYCNTALQIDGPWHVEHQLPRALGGDDKPLNLVASCVACNLKKSDRTALEFVSSKVESRVT
ncbi:MAG: HNH endonuclease [Ramlibacter sp.]